MASRDYMEELHEEAQVVQAAEKLRQRDGTVTKKLFFALNM